MVALDIHAYYEGWVERVKERKRKNEENHE